MIYLLDTDVFTLAQLGRPEVGDRIAAARTQSHEVVVSVVTRIEVLRGRFEALLKAADGAAVQRMQEQLFASDTFLSTFQLLAFDPTSAGSFDQLRANKKLNKMDAGDRLQAAVALANERHTRHSEYQRLRERAQPEARKLGRVNISR